MHSNWILLIGESEAPRGQLGKISIRWRYIPLSSVFLIVFADLHVHFPGKHCRTVTFINNRRILIWEQLCLIQSNVNILMIKAVNVVAREDPSSRVCGSWLSLIEFRRPFSLPDCWSCGQTCCDYCSRRLRSICCKLCWACGRRRLSIQRGHICPIGRRSTFKRKIYVQTFKSTSKMPNKNSVRDKNSGFFF